MLNQSHSGCVVINSRSGSAEKVEDAQANVFINKVLNIHKQLASRKDLEICDEVVNFFLEITSLCNTPVTDRFTSLVFENPQIKGIISHLRDLCAQVESNFEKYWNLNIIKNENCTEQEVCEQLRQLPNYSPNKKMIDAELSALRSVKKTPIKKIAFIGSGPVPITALLLRGDLTGAPTNISVTAIDRDRQALANSQIFCQRLGSKGQGIDFVCEDADSEYDLYNYDVVYLANLVGSTQEQKEALLHTIALRMKPESLLVLRSSKNLKGLMFTIFDPTTEAMSRIIDIENVVYPSNHNIVDVVFIARVKRDLAKS